MDVASGSGSERRLDAAEEDPRDQEPDPDHEAEQAHEIDRGELAEAVLPELAEVRQDADREEGKDKEDHAERVGFANRRRELGKRRGRARERDNKPDHERYQEADDELRKALPDFRGLRLVARDVNVVRPDIGEQESPDADEDVDEDLYRRSGAQNPARLII